MTIKIPFAAVIILMVFLSIGSFAQKKPTPQSQTHKKSSPATQPVKKSPKTNTRQPASTEIIKFTPEQVDGFRQQSSQMVKFFEGTLNFLADKSNPVKEKQIIINESYEKTFWDSKVQVEDDLDEKRMVTLYKDIQAYLSDVDFFFIRAKFEYTVQDVSVMTNETGQTYFKVTANRNLSGMTVNNDSVNNNKVRYFEINYDETKEQLKIVSIYTTKLDEKSEMRIWWNELSDNWKEVFGKEMVIDESTRLNQVTIFHDSTGMVNGVERNVDPVKFYGLLAQIINRKELSIAGNSTITDLGPLSKLSLLKNVNLSNTQVVDLMPLRNLNGLEILDISGTQVNILDPLRYNNNIRSLKLKKSKITSLSLVSGFPLLEVLDFSSTSITDLGPLKDLTGLKDLRFSETSVTDLTPISGLINLEILYFSDVPVTDISPLKNFTNLQLVFLDNTKVSSLAAFDNLPALHKIYSDKTSIDRNEALRFMKEHPSVTVIFESEELTKWWGKMSSDWKKIFTRYLKSGEEPTIEQLHRLTTIDSINISGRLSINTLDPISEFVKLKYLDCSSTSITSLEPMRQLTELKTVNLSNTKISTLEPLSGMQRMEILTIDNTAVSDISFLKKLKELKFIFADNTQISSNTANSFMDDVSGCLVISQTYDNNNWWKNLNQEWKDALLKQLNISGDPDKIQLQQIAGLEKLIVGEDATIISLTPLLHLSRLKEFQFTDTRVTSLVPLGQMKKLTAIRCMKNPISDLSPIAGMTNLKELDFSNTQVEDLLPLENLRNLEILKFSGTPVKTLKYLQNLLRLKVMEFYNTRISNLEVLEPMSSLHSLKIFNTKVSEKKVTKFKATHPGCEVIFY
jgi:Leucine-rich repeat (LRR) protein